MKPYRLLLALTLTSTAIAATSDPFVGTWIYNVQRSPKPTITYGIKDLGGDRYVLTGSTGQTTEIKTDGVSIKIPSGATVSFKKLDDHTWQMDRADGVTLVRTYTVSADDKALILHDIFTMPDGSKEETTTTYSRTSSGKSIFGQWKSVSMDEKTSGKPSEFVIQPYGKEGLTFISESDKRQTDMNFDGKEYFETGPNGKTGQSSAGKRVSAHVIQMESQSKGKPEDNDEFKVSDDGKTLTITIKSLKTAAVFMSVWDRQ